jgi:hypothetical protein
MLYEAFLYADSILGVNRFPSSEVPNRPLIIPIIPGPQQLHTLPPPPSRLHTPQATSQHRAHKAMRVNISDINC